MFNNRPFLGTEVWEGTASTQKTKPYIEGLGVDFVKLPILWSHVEISDGVYVWPTAYDRDVAYLRSINVLPVLTVKMAPAWARLKDARLCGRPDNPLDYAEFVAEVAKRYQGILAIEIWNEPDTNLGAADYYGCWGDPAEPYYGGLFYKAVLDVSYPAIKLANPETIVIAGALTLPCEGACAMDTYIQGWANSPNYDAVSFHHYPIDSDTTRLNNAILYLRQFTDKPLWLSETAIIAGNCTTTQEQQSVEWANILKSEWRLSSIAWFALQPTGWYCVDLLYPDWTEKPVYKEWAK